MKKKKKIIVWKDETVIRGEKKKEGRKEKEHEATFEIDIFALPGGIIAEKDVFIEMRDGIKLAVNVFRPDKPGKFPIIISFIGPYGKDISPHAYSVFRYEYFVELGLTIGKLRISEATPFEGPDPAFWVPNDYVVIHVDTRGFFKSEGERQVLSEAEMLDYYEVIEWAGTQEWSNGNVGLSGVSYLAWAQWYAASTEPPHLKAIIPWEGVSDFYRDWHFPGGIPESKFYPEWKKRNVEQTKDADLTVMLDPVLNQKEIKGNPQLEKITVPALICASWSDHGLHTRGAFEAFKRIFSQDKWLYTHGRRKWEEYYSDEGLEYQKKFFDHFLKGVDSGIMDTPRVRLEVREALNEYTVRYENEWPIARTEYKKLYLDTQTGTLNFDEVPKEGKASYDSANGKLEFDMTFDQDTEISGHMKLKLWVSAEEADDMDLLIGVKKLDTEGNEVHFFGTAMSAYIKGMVSRGWLRLSQRELDKKRSTLWQPVLKHQGEQKLKPGEIVSAEIEILPSSTLFRKGETLRLVIQGKDLVEGDPTGWLGYTHLVNEGVHSIYTGGEYDSHLLIPVIPAGSE
ncbi:MAG: CocE/NonD family hydrolase [Deltaproteobacteria bacterium]|nr:CocE/NonD family hydrolase [Deltaproteobacteria bacterium]